MKKAKYLLFGAMVGVMFVGLGGCGANPTPCNILVDNAKTVFEIGDAFALSEDMQVNLQFTNEKIMALSAVDTLQHNEITKKYTCSTFEIDYSEFDSTKGGNYPIFITYNDQDNDTANDLRVYFYVQVQKEFNDWVHLPQISESWAFGETPTFTPGEVDFLQDSAEYYYRLKTTLEYTQIATDNVAEELKVLNAGEYDFKVVYPETDTITGLEYKLSFTINRIALEESIVPVLASQAYTGQPIFPEIPDSPYYSFSYSFDSSFINVGFHDVVLVLNDMNYKWPDTDSITKTIKFEITPATNEWTSSTLDLQSVGTEKGWIEGMFDETQFVEPTAQFGKVLYQYKPQDADDAQYQNIAIEQLDVLAVGEYTLRAYVQTSDNYSSPSPITINFVVQEA